MALPGDTVVRLDHPLRQLAIKLAGNPPPWEDFDTVPRSWCRAVAEARDILARRPALAHDLGEALRARRRLGTDSVAFLIAALSYEALWSPDPELALGVLVHPTCNASLLPQQVLVAQSVLDALGAPDGRREFVLHKLADGFAQAPFGSRGDNQEQALRYYREALDIAEVHGDPLSVSSLHSSLGSLYQERIRGPWQHNSDQAIEHIEQARATLEGASDAIEKKAEYKRRLSGILLNLGNAHRDRPPKTGQAPDARMREAVKLLVRSLLLREPESLERAETLRNLAITHMHLARSPDTNDLDKAHLYFQQACDLYAKHEDRGASGAAMSSRYALTINQLAIVKARLGQPAEARKLFATAAARYHGLDRRRELLSVLFNWGLLEMDAEQWTDAHQKFEQAAELMEAEVGVHQTDHARIAWMRHYAGVYECVVATSVILGESEEIYRCDDSQAELPYSAKALVWAEQSAARTLLDWMSRPDAPSARLDLLDVGFQLEAAEAKPEKQRDLQQIAGLRDAEGSLSRDTPQLLEPWCSETPGIIVGRAHRAARENDTAILILRASKWGTLAILVTPSGRLAVKRCPEMPVARIEALVDRWQSGYRSFRKGVQDKSTTYRVLRQQWQQEMSDVLADLGGGLVGPLWKWLARYMPQPTDHDAPADLCIVPGPGFNVLPLHAAAWHDDRQTVLACDRYVMSYAPSAQILDRCTQREEHVSQVPLRLLAVQNPDDSFNSVLVFDDFVEQLRERFCESLALGSPDYPVDGAASLSRLAGYSDRAASDTRRRGELEKWEFVVLATHGVYQALNVWEQSGVHVAEAPDSRTKAFLAPADVYRMDLSRQWLTVLAACESAVTEAKDLSGEQIGMPTSLLAAGTTAVVGALWPLEAGPSALTLERFFDALLDDNAAGQSRSRALWQAQRWLRTRSRDEIVQAYRDLHPSLTVQFAAQRPYEHPFFWAGFSCYGAATSLFRRRENALLRIRG